VDRFDLVCIPAIQGNKAGQMHAHNVLFQAGSHPEEKQRKSEGSWLHTS